MIRAFHVALLGISLTASGISAESSKSTEAPHGIWRQVLVVADGKEPQLIGAGTNSLVSISRLIHGTVGLDTTTLQEQNPEDDPCEQTRRFMYFDDLADVYFDLKAGLLNYETGTAVGMSEATWKWKWGYEYHWGAHLMRALRTTHEIRCELYLA